MYAMCNPILSYYHLVSFTATEHKLGIARVDAHKLVDSECDSILLTLGICRAFMHKRVDENFDSLLERVNKSRTQVLKRGKLKPPVRTVKPSLVDIMVAKSTLNTLLSDEPAQKENTDQDVDEVDNEVETDERGTAARTYSHSRVPVASFPLQFVDNELIFEIFEI